MGVKKYIKIIIHWIHWILIWFAGFVCVSFLMIYFEDITTGVIEILGSILFNPFTPLVILIALLLFAATVLRILGGPFTPEFKPDVEIDFKKPVRLIWARCGIIFSRHYTGRRMVAWYSSVSGNFAVSNGRNFSFPCSRDPLYPYDKNYVDYRPDLESDNTIRYFTVGRITYRAKYFKTGKVLIVDNHSGTKVAVVWDLLLWALARFNPAIPLLNALLLHELARQYYPKD